MIKFFKRKVEYTFKQEEILSEDKSNIENFTTSLLCISIEKTLRNRIKDREQNVIAFVKEGNVQQALVFASQMEELEDVLLEWKNIRTDIEKKNSKQENDKA